MLFFLPIMGFSQFKIKYYPTPNRMTVRYTGCDICRLGSIQAVLTCECRKECEIPSQESIDELNDCIDYCEDEYGDNPFGTDLDYCLDACEGDLWLEELNCKNECGPGTKPLKNVTQYLYRLKVAWADIPNDPRNSDNIIYKNGNTWTHHWESNYPTSVYILPWNDVVSPWPGIYSNHNTCYGIEILIFYDDGTTCGFNIWECNIIG